MVDTAQLIRECRKKARLSQAEFAVRLGASQGSVSKWERGTEIPRFSILTKLSAEFGLDTAKLLFPKEHELGTSFESAGPIKIVGAVEYGAYRESPKWAEEDWLSIDLPLDKEFDIPLEGYVVKDDSANVLFAKDTVVFVSKGSGIFTDKILIFDGDVILARRASAGLYENTLWKVTIAEDRIKSLVSLSTASGKSEIVDMSDDGLSEQISLAGLVMVTLHHLPAYKRVQKGSHVYLSDKDIF